ncbi:WD40 repeat-like protein [Suillus brevipes Sb2]|nr:WD40 repeat-like protein [Suillus brevipes Sb2]
MAVTTHKASPKAPSQPTRKEQLVPHVKMTLKGHEERVNDVAFIHGTRLLVTGSDDKSVRVWDLDTGKQVGESLLGHDAGVWVLAASPDGRWIVSGGYNGSILIWEVATNKTELKRLPVSFKGHEIEVRPVRDVVFAPDSKAFASASWDQTVCVWKRETGELVFGPLKVGSAAHSVAYSPDGTKLAAGTDKHIIVWNLKTGKELLKIEQRAFRLAFTPDGLRLVSGNRKDIRISDATTGDIIKQFDAHTTQLFHALAIAPNGTKFATTSYDMTTRFFDLTTFEQIGEPLDHPDGVLCVAFSKDIQFIATGCEDKLVRTWTVPLSETELQQVSKSSRRVIPHSDLPYSPRRKSSRRAPIQTTRFFDGFDPHSSSGRNNRAATTTRNTDGFKNTMNQLFSHSSAPHNHAPPRRSIPLVDVFATRGKHRTANRHTAERDKKLQQQCPPRNQAHAGASSSNTPPAGTSNAGRATLATLRTEGANASATTTHPSQLDVEHVNTTCFAVLTGCFPRLSRTRQTHTAAPRTC